MDIGTLETSLVFNLKWKIDKFSSWSRGIYAKKFKFADEAWYLKLQRQAPPRKSIERCEQQNKPRPADIDKVSLVIATDSCCKIKFCTGYQLLCRKEALKSKEIIHEFSPDEKEKAGFFPTAELSKHLEGHPEDDVIITCSMEVTEEPVVESQPSGSGSGEDEEQLSQELGSLDVNNDN